MTWINAKETPPDKERTIVAYYKHRSGNWHYVNVLYKDDGYYYYDDDGEVLDEQIKYYFYLPELPKE